MTSLGPGPGVAAAAVGGAKISEPANNRQSAANFRNRNCRLHVMDTPFPAPRSGPSRPSHFTQMASGGARTKEGIYGQLWSRSLDAIALWPVSRLLRTANSLNFGAVDPRRIDLDQPHTECGRATGRRPVSRLPAFPRSTASRDDGLRRISPVALHRGKGPLTGLIAAGILAARTSPTQNQAVFKAALLPLKGVFVARARELSHSERRRYLTRRMVVFAMARTVTRPP